MGWDGYGGTSLNMACALILAKFLPQNSTASAWGRGGNGAEV